jgi:hypothetical protein
MREIITADSTCTSVGMLFCHVCFIPDNGICSDIGFACRAVKKVIGQVLLTPSGSAKNVIH